jgi:predicted dehydrogenase
MTINRKLRVGLFGAGDFGREFARYVREYAALVAVCEPDAAARARFAAATGLHLPEFERPGDLLAGVEVDAVAITSPHHTHKEIAVAAARAGKHVYCEKAMANSVPDCWEMVRACQAAGVRLMVGHKRRLRPPWARMIELRERLGPVRAISACGYYDARPYDHRGWWTRRDQCGGTLPLAGVHVIDWMRAMAGDVAAVRAVAAPQIDHRYDFPDTLHVGLQFRSGAVASLDVSLGFPLLRYRESSGPQVVCADGGIRLVPSLERLDLYWQHRDDAAARHERFDDLGFDHAYRREFSDFVRWVTEGAEPCLTWREGLRCVEVMEAAHRSAAEGGTVIPLPLYPGLEPGAAEEKP